MKNTNYKTHIKTFAYLIMKKFGLKKMAKLLSHGIYLPGTLNIMQTCPCNVYPLTPNFYIAKLGCTGVYNLLIFALNHRLWVLVRNASLRRF